MTPSRKNRRAARVAPARRFTLIELLTVVVILLILVALLLPSLEEARYQGQLTACAAHQKGIGTGITSYAADHDRLYPSRSGMAGTWKPNFLAGNGHDDRPALSPYLPITEIMNDPLTTPVDLESSSSTTTYTGGSYLLFGGFQYHASGTESLMKRLGSRFTFNGSTFDVLVGDRDVSSPTNAFNHGSHPDRSRMRKLERLQAQPSVWGGGNHTLSRWISANGLRGLDNLNFCFDDLSVRRVTRVTQTDNRLVQVPEFSNYSTLTFAVLQIPDENF